MLSRLWEALPTPAAGGQPRFRGGYRQQAQFARALVANDMRVWGISRLAGGQLLLVCDGHISAAQLGRTMRDAVADGLDHPMVRRLATIREHNAQSDLTRLLVSSTNLLDWIVALPNSDVTHVLLPTNLIQTMHTHYPAKFRTRFGCDAAALSTFWKGIRARPEYKARIDEHPLLRGKSLAELQ